MNALCLEDVERTFQLLRQTKARLDVRGFFPATSGNLSARIGPFSPDRFAFAVTTGGRDKSDMSPEDFLIVDQNGRPVGETRLKPSAETLIHCEIYRLTGCGAVVHAHTVFNNLASKLYREQGGVPIEGCDMLKAFGIWETGAPVELPILPNDGDAVRVARSIKSGITRKVPGFLLHNHGIFVWGDDLQAARRHLEAFEFLLELRCRLDGARRS